MILAFNIECACPLGLREASVAGGDYSSVEDFDADYHLTHIECPRCHTYFRLVSYVDDEGELFELEQAVSRRTPPPVRQLASVTLSRGALSRRRRNR